MSFPPDPWKLLELDRSTAGEREIKRAYARLLKQHRPDQDPEGFQRVNAAYQQAMQSLRQDSGKTPFQTAQAGMAGPAAGDHPAADQGSSGEREKVPGAEPDGATAEETPVSVSRFLENFPSLPPAFTEGWERLREWLHRQSGGSAPPQPKLRDGDLPEFNQLRNLTRSDPAALAVPWAAVVNAMFSTEAGLQLLPRLYPQDVLLLMRHGGEGCAVRILLTWRENHLLLTRLSQLGNLMIDQKAAQDPAMIQAIYFTARLAAFHLPQTAGRLADELFRLADPSSRAQIAREIEIRMMAGKTFSRFPLAQRRVWERILFEAGDGSGDWDSPEKRLAVQSVLVTCNRDWEGWPLVSQMVPQSVLEQISDEVRGRTATARQEKKTFSPAFGRWAFVVCWAVVHLLVAVFRQSGSPTQDAGSSTPSGPSFAEAQQENQKRRTKLKALLDENQENREKMIKSLEHSSPSKEEELDVEDALDSSPLSGSRARPEGFLPFKTVPSEAPPTGTDLWDTRENQGGSIGPLPSISFDPEEGGSKK
ncbi:MAG: hypothetical protein JWM59_374 [Verrucomicrobiales bacterium]|nr:hypothetical protein [Verrucomicrobiales bacterium]